MENRAWRGENWCCVQNVCKELWYLSFSVYQSMWKRARGPCWRTDGTTIVFIVSIAPHLYSMPRSGFTISSSISRDIQSDSWGIRLTNRASADDTIDGSLSERESARCNVSEEALIEWFRFLFKNSSLSLRSIERHDLVLWHRPLDKAFEMPETIFQIHNQQVLKIGENPVSWCSILETVRYLSVIVLTFAFVKGLEKPEDLPACASPDVLSRHALRTRLEWWDGKSPIWIHENIWFRTWLL